VSYLHRGVAAALGAVIHARAKTINQAIKHCCLLSCAFFLVGCGASEIAAPADQGIRPARIVEVSLDESLKQMVFVGRIEASNAIDVSFEVAGALQSFPVREGQTLKKGELIAELDPIDYELAVREAQLQLQLAQQDYQRKADVLRRGGIAKSLVADAKSFALLQGVRLKQAQHSLRDTKMYAPFDAYVSRRYVDNYVKTQVGDRIVRLNDLHQLLVVASIPEQLLASVIDNSRATVFAVFDFMPGQMFPLKYRENRGDANSVGQTYEVSFAMARPDSREILPGMTATLVVRFAENPNSAPEYLLPISALVTDAEKKVYVWLFDQTSQKVRKRYVSVGRPTPSGVYVTQGLVEGDLIVSSGANQLIEGMKIRPLD
jgi:RND family efflux transporter MFP subunit